MRTLEELRSAIDEADDRIAAALSDRFALADEMAELKRLRGLPAKDGEREREVIERVFARTPIAQRDTVFSIYERIFGGARGLIETVARGVCVIDGKVLLCKSKGGRSSYLPGGHIEFGETGAEALVREVKEELGVDSTAGELLGSLENSFLQNGRRHCEINLIYRLELDPAVAQAVRESPSACEPWLEFVWGDVGDLAGVNLLPETIRGFVR